MDQGGKNMCPKNIFASPHNPPISFHFALAVWLSLHADKFEKTEKFFASGYAGAGQSSQNYNKGLTKMLLKFDGEVREFVRINHCNSHDGHRKGGVIHVMTSSTAPPPMPSVLIRGDWSMGKVLDIQHQHWQHKTLSKGERIQSIVTMTALSAYVYVAALLLPVPRKKLLQEQKQSTVYNINTDNTKLSQKGNEYNQQWQWQHYLPLSLLLHCCCQFPGKKSLGRNNGNNQQFTTSTLTTQNSLRRGTHTINSDNDSTIRLCLCCCIAAASSVGQSAHNHHNFITITTSITIKLAWETGGQVWLVSFETGLMLSLLRWGDFAAFLAFCQAAPCTGTW
jgi:hypothetical protein